MAPAEIPGVHYDWPLWVTCLSLAHSAAGGSGGGVPLWPVEVGGEVTGTWVPLLGLTKRLEEWDLG